MLSNWHNFFYVSLDKPPLDFWLQVLSAKIFGFNPLSLMLPQALAGVFSVVLLAHLVHRSFGSLAALAAALALTVTPISVITNRNNDVDSMLVLVVLLAAWAVIIATEKGSLRWLLLGLGLVGLGFNIKMAEAYLVVPAFVLLYLLTARRHWSFRIWHLALGYNGLNRLLGHRPATLPPTSKDVSTKTNSVVIERPPGAIGYPGPTRLFNDQLAGQISWLLPLALVGIGMLWHEFNHRSRRGWFLPGALLIAALVQVRFLAVFPTSSNRLTPVIVGITLAVAVVLCVIGLIRRRSGSVRYVSGPLTLLALCALLITPTVWAIAPIVQQRNSGFPIAEPYPTTGPPPKQSAAAGSSSSTSSTQITLSPNDPALIHYLEEHQGTASYLVATNSSNFAAPIIVEAGRAVMAIGGYSGGDHILTRAQLVTLVREGVVRFFLLSSTRTIYNASLRMRQERAAHLSLTGGTTSWVASICRVITPTTWHPAVEGKTLSLSNNLVLYDCGGVF